MNIKTFEKYTVKQLAQASGLPSSFISRCKSGDRKIPIPRARMIHERIGCPLEYLRPDVYGDVA